MICLAGGKQWRLAGRARERRERLGGQKGVRRWDRQACSVEELKKGGLVMLAVNLCRSPFLSRRSKATSWSECDSELGLGELSLRKRIGPPSCSLLLVFSPRARYSSLSCKTQQEVPYLDRKNSTHRDPATSYFWQHPTKTTREED